MSRIAIVVQRCHESVVGGAESLAWHWAVLLEKTYQVDVLTTTAVDATTWGNALSPGTEKRDGIAIQRFKVDQGRTPYWHGLHKLLLNEFAGLSHFTMTPGLPRRDLFWPLALQEEFILKQGPYSEGLVNFLSEHWPDYQAIIFFTYLFPTTYFGMRKVPKNRCLFVPTLHNEAPAYLSAYRYMAQRTRSLLWNTGAERQLGSYLWGDLPGKVVGMGINVEEFSPFEPGYPYLLYCGRIDPYKGGHELIDYFLKYKKENPSDLRLILTGKDELGLPGKPDIQFKGFVPEDEKFRLMAGALLFVMPSPYESLSIVTLEAMAQRTPALVNEKSQVLVDHIKESSGGFIYDGYDRFSSAINDLLKTPSKRITMGTRARDYVIAHYSVEHVKDRLREVIEADTAG